PVLSPFKRMLGDINGDEMERKDIPQWVLDVLQNRPRPSVSSKIGFFLESWNAKEMPHLKESKSKLTSHRILKIKKVCQYVLQNLQIKPPTRREWMRGQQRSGDVTVRTKSKLHRTPPPQSKEDALHPA